MSWKTISIALGTWPYNLGLHSSLHFTPINLTQSSKDIVELNYIIILNFPDYLTCSISDLNMCIPNPCKNGGQCLGYEGGHKCICLPGYKGESCEGGYLVNIFYSSLVSRTFGKVLSAKLKTRRTIVRGKY